MGPTKKKLNGYKRLYIASTFLPILVRASLKFFKEEQNTKKMRPVQRMKAGSLDSFFVSSW